MIVKANFKLEDKAQAEALVDDLFQLGSLAGDLSSLLEVMGHVELFGDPEVEVPSAIRAASRLAYTAFCGLTELSDLVSESNGLTRRMKYSSMYTLHGTHGGLAEWHRPA